ncbi:uncharacterized protein EDB91DRAFT_1250923 [Suillus paluster]|uniref:uncharacterized protein n=1 Tax=Suillus paluster TaxID=48578 RepID=UPI001B865EE3|nr:uncharacterized protein EDB91DRAFT_1250923 [Suillus paluster]KAG1734411.1 hypothetical protein EDB91DRAFT_1250923 [Suillus paluster]
MSQPASTVSKCMTTQAKNATQHPGHYMTGGEGRAKRRTKAQKSADDQREKEAKEASETAVQERHKRIATFQKQMETNQAAMCADAPKPSHPRPHPVKKGVKASDTSNMTTVCGQEGAGIVADKAVGAKVKGGRATYRLLYRLHSPIARIAKCPIVQAYYTSV